MIQIRLFTLGFLMMLGQLLIGGSEEKCVLEEMDGRCADLEVMIEKDCYNVESDGIATYYISIFSGTPPFTIEILYPEEGGQYTLQDFGFIEYRLEDGVVFEVLAADNTGQEIYDFGGELGCVKGWYLCSYAYSDLSYETNCLENGKVAVQINSEYVDAYYMDSDGYKFPLNSLDTVPNLSYIAIKGTNNYIKDSFVNCLAANGDLVEVLEGETITFNVLDNDFGQNIQVVNIIELPQCGELLEWSADGIMTYKMEEGEDCSEDEMVYELKNDLGKTATASVHFQKVTEEQADLEQMYLYSELDCDDSGCELYVQIKNGIPPYTITGYYNDLLEGNEFGLYIDCHSDVAFEVEDSEGEIATFELKYTEHFCNEKDCYEPLFAYQYLDVECLEGQGGVLYFLDRMQPSLLEKAFYIDSNNDYHDLQEFDTIPNHSYYYLELQYFLDFGQRNPI